MILKSFTDKINIFCSDKHIINKQYVGGNEGYPVVCFIDYVPGICPDKLELKESELPLEESKNYISGKRAVEQKKLDFFVNENGEKYRNKKTIVEKSFA